MRYNNYCTDVFINRFTEDQASILASYFDAGMTGTGANFQYMIESASNECGLTKEQIVVCMCCSI